MNDSSNKPQGREEMIDAASPGAYVSPDSQHAKAMTPEFNLDSFMSYIVGESTENFDLMDYFGPYNAYIVQSYKDEIIPLLLANLDETDDKFTSDMFVGRRKSDLKKIFDKISTDLKSQANDAIDEVHRRLTSSVLEDFTPGKPKRVTCDTERTSRDLIGDYVVSELNKINLSLQSDEVEGELEQLHVSSQTTHVGNLASADVVPLDNPLQLQHGPDREVIGDCLKGSREQRFQKDVDQLSLYRPADYFSEESCGGDEIRCYSSLGLTKKRAVNKPNEDWVNSGETADGFSFGILMDGNSVPKGANKLTTVLGSYLTQKLSEFEYSNATQYTSLQTLKRALNGWVQGFNLLNKGHDLRTTLALVVRLPMTEGSNINYAVLNIGDSFICKLSEGKLSLLAKRHVQWNSKNQPAIAKVVRYNQAGLDCDTSDLKEVSLVPGEEIVMCSDGLPVNRNQMRAIDVASIETANHDEIEQGRDALQDFFPFVEGLQDSPDNFAELLKKSLNNNSTVKDNIALWINKPAVSVQPKKLVDARIYSSSVVFTVDEIQKVTEYHLSPAGVKITAVRNFRDGTLDFKYSPELPDGFGLTTYVSDLINRFTQRYEKSNSPFLKTQLVQEFNRLFGDNYCFKIENTTYDKEVSDMVFRAKDVEFKHTLKESHELHALSNLGYVSYLVDCLYFLEGVACQNLQNKDWFSPTQRGGLGIQNRKILDLIRKACTDLNVSSEHELFILVKKYIVLLSKYKTFPVVSDNYVQKLMLAGVVPSPLMVGETDTVASLILANNLNFKELLKQSLLFEDDLIALINYGCTTKFPLEFVQQILLQKPSLFLPGNGQFKLLDFLKTQNAHIPVASVLKILSLPNSLSETNVLDSNSFEHSQLLALLPYIKFEGDNKSENYKIILKSLTGLTDGLKSLITREPKNSLQSFGYTFKVVETGNTENPTSGIQLVDNEGNVIPARYYDENIKYLLQSSVAIGTKQEYVDFLNLNSKHLGLKGFNVWNKLGHGLVNLYNKFNYRFLPSVIKYQHKLRWAYALSMITYAGTAYGVHELFGDDLSFTESVAGGGDGGSEGSPSEGGASTQGGGSVDPNITLRVVVSDSSNGGNDLGNSGISGEEGSSNSMQILGAAALDEGVDPEVPATDAGVAADVGTSLDAGVAQGVTEPSDYDFRWIPQDSGVEAEVPDGGAGLDAGVDVEDTALGTSEQTEQAAPEKEADSRVVAPEQETDNDFAALKQQIKGAQKQYNADVSTVDALHSDHSDYHSGSYDPNSSADLQKLQAASENQPREGTEVNVRTAGGRLLLRDDNGDVMKTNTRFFSKTIGLSEGQTATATGKSKLVEVINTVTNRTEITIANEVSYTLKGKKYIGWLNGAYTH